MVSGKLSVWFHCTGCWLTTWRRHCPDRPPAQGAVANVPPRSDRYRGVLSGAYPSNVSWYGSDQAAAFGEVAPPWPWPPVVVKEYTYPGFRVAVNAPPCGVMSGWGAYRSFGSTRSRSPPPAPAGPVDSPPVTA